MLLKSFYNLESIQLHICMFVDLLIVYGINVIKKNNCVSSEIGSLIFVSNTITMSVIKQNLLSSLTSVHLWLTKQWSDPSLGILSNACLLSLIQIFCCNMWIYIIFKVNKIFLIPITVKGNYFDATIFAFWVKWFLQL